MSEEILPLRLIVQKFKYLDEDHREKVREKCLKYNIEYENCIFVTQLVYCPLKRLFHEAYPDLVIQNYYEPKVIIGRLVAYGLEHVLNNFDYSDWIFKSEVEGEKVVEVDNINYLILGRIDGVIQSKIHDRRIGVEFKVTAHDLPPDHYIEQCKIYNLMFDLEYCYLVMMNRDKIYTYVVDEKYTDNDLLNLVEEYVNMVHIPRWDWECKICPFVKLCPFSRGE